MNPEFWHERWQNQRIGFHQQEGSAELRTHIDALGLKKGAHIFVPLCGKSRDIGWLLAKGYRIVAAELSEIAVNALFKDLGVKPNVVQLHDIKRYSAQDINVYVGDIFKLTKVQLTQDELSDIDAIFDRAALIALPNDMRKSYAKYLVELTNRAPQLVIALVYEHSLFEGPPFSVSNAELMDCYSQYYDICLLEKGSAELRDKEVEQEVWLLNPY